MLTSTQQKIVERIRKGGFTTAHWSEVAGSRKSLNVQIYHLRAMGYEIEVSRTWQRGARGSRPATYKLIKEPDQ